MSTPASTTAAKEQANPSSGGTILAFGDSNTTSTYAESWGVKLGRLTGRRVVVSAKGNETTAGGLGRLAGAIRSSGATTVCIMQGTVDAIKGISASTAAANVARMVGIAKAEGATLVVVGTPPAAPSKSFGAAVSAIASAIASAAAARGARVANVHGATNNKALMIADGFHLNNSGMTTVAGVFADKV